MKYIIDYDLQHYESFWGEGVKTPLPHPVDIWIMDSILCLNDTHKKLKQLSPEFNSRIRGKILTL